MQELISYDETTQWLPPNDKKLLAEFWNKYKGTDYQCVVEAAGRSPESCMPMLTQKGYQAAAARAAQAHLRHAAEQAEYPRLCIRSASG